MDLQYRSVSEVQLHTYYKNLTFREDIRILELKDEMLS